MRKTRMCYAAVAGMALLVGVQPAAPASGRGRGKLCGTQSTAVHVTFKPYIQPGDGTTLSGKDVMVIAWQTDETVPNAASYTVEYGKTSYTGSLNPVGRVVDDYLAADPVTFASFITMSGQYSFLNGTPPVNTAYQAHTDYYTTLTGLDYDSTYIYRVSGPGLPTSGFTGTFHTRKTGTQFSFEVQGDEGYYPGIPGQPGKVSIYESRIIHLMYNVQNLSIPGLPALPAADLALNTGDNVYTVGSDGNYRDVWMRDWNNDTDSNDTGAPFLRSIPLYIVVGNHDIGSTGASANLLGDTGSTLAGSSGPGRFGGNLGGGDAMAHFNNFYDPLNGPTGVDIQSVFNGDVSSLTGFFFKYGATSYTSPAAIEALRASTAVDTGKGAKRQIDHQSNYSFDYGNAHFVFLDANPHLFNQLLPGGPPSTAPDFPFTGYPSVLKHWLINDLDSSRQTWKVVVFHQPAFSSGNATISNDQMRLVAKFLEDHGVNMVFNGHEHNYQRSLPIRALSGVTRKPGTASPAVAVDKAFDGISNTVPDGVLYFVEGAGGHRDFDDDLPNPRGGGSSIDQDDAATGTKTISGTSYLNGPASWLDVNLTTNAMKNFVPGAGSGQKITSVFKSKVFSFADVVVNDNILTLYQISEPLSNSRTNNNGTDYLGNPLNDPIPDTILDTTTTPPSLTQSAGTGGASALLDKITITKPNVTNSVTAKLTAPAAAKAGGALVYTIAVTNRGGFALNGTQVVLTLPTGVSLVSPTSDTLTLQGGDVVATIGRLAPGTTSYLQIQGVVSNPAPASPVMTTPATVRSSTALPIQTNSVATKIVSSPGPRP